MSAGPGGGAGSRKTQLIVLAVLAAIIVVVSIVLSQSGADDDTPSGDASNAGDQTQQVADNLDGIPQDGVFLGDADAPETVTEYVDLQCPFCGEFARKAFPDVVDQHVRSGDIRYELRVISFLGADSKTAAQAAASATLQNKLYDFAETFYLNQGEENTGFVTDDFLHQIADATPGLDSDELFSQLDSADADAVVAENEAAGKTAGVNSTPTFILTSGGATKAMNLSALTADAFTDALESARGGQ